MHYHLKKREKNKVKPSIELGHTQCQAQSSEPLLMGRTTCCAPQLNFFKKKRHVRQRIAQYHTQILTTMVAEKLGYLGFFF